MSEQEWLNERLLAALAEIERLKGELALLWPLASALEDDARHGNLTGRSEDAWNDYEKARDER